MPLITRRSSARSTPRTSVGRCGSIRSHCGSLSQNNFLRTSQSPKTNHAVWNKDCLASTAELLSSGPSKKLLNERYGYPGPICLSTAAIALLKLRRRPSTPHAVLNCLKNGDAGNGSPAHKHSISGPPTAMPRLFAEEWDVFDSSGADHEVLDAWRLHQRGGNDRSIGQEENKRDANQKQRNWGACRRFRLDCFEVARYRLRRD
jgi:hypothetical protein